MQKLGCGKSLVYKLKLLRVTMSQEHNDEEEMGFVRRFVDTSKQGMLGRLDGELLKIFDKFTPELLSSEGGILRVELLQKASNEFFKFMSEPEEGFHTKIETLLHALGGKKLTEIIEERSHLLESLRPAYSETIGSWHHRDSISLAEKNYEMIGHHLKMNTDILGVIRVKFPDAFLEYSSESRVPASRPIAIRR